MLIHPWDAAISEAEWRDWLTLHDFGQLAVSDPDNGAPDYAYIPTTSRAKAGGPDEDGVPTSYYAAVQLTCQAEIVDDPQQRRRTPREPRIRPRPLRSRPATQAPQGNRRMQAPPLTLRVASAQEPVTSPRCLWRRIRNQ